MVLMARRKCCGAHVEHCRCAGGFAAGFPRLAQQRPIHNCDHSLVSVIISCPPVQGITADVDGVSVAVGNLRLLAAATEGDLPASVSAADGDWRAQGMTVLWVAVSGRPAGAIVVSDAARREAADAVAALRRQKLHCVMLTGGCSSVDRETLSLSDPAQRWLPPHRCQMSTSARHHARCRA